MAKAIEVVVAETEKAASQHEIFVKLPNSTVTDMTESNFHHFKGGAEMLKIC